MTKRKYSIPLSYNPIEPVALARMLEAYEGRPHEELVLDFESSLREITGSKFVAALNSGTSAIHLGLKALNVGRGDLVIASTFTYVASINPILYLQAEPVFVDSELGTWNMDPQLLEQAILHCLKEKKKPRAIILVYTYGMPAQIERILSIAKHFEIPVLEDAAEAIGSSFEQRALGSIGAVGILSFNNNKIMTTYGGGALLTDDETIFEKVTHWSTQSRENLPYYEHAELGFNYRMGPLNAAMGLVQLEDLQSKIKRRREIFATYQRLLEGTPGIGWQSEPANAISNRWISGVLLSSPPSDVRQRLESEGIETRPLWKPMHIQPLFKNYPAFLNDSSSFLFKNGMCLPSGNDLTDENIETITSVIRRG